LICCCGNEFIIPFYGSSCSTIPAFSHYITVHTNTHTHTHTHTQSSAQLHSSLVESPLSPWFRTNSRLVSATQAIGKPTEYEATDTESGGVPETTGHRPQRDEPPCESGTAEKVKWQEGVQSCRSRLAQEKRRQKKLYQDQR
jgi:hypothetical protein